jgi:transposase InsO family protein
LDFVEGLPRSGTADCILVVVDKFTKYAHFIPLPHPYTALTVAQLFISQVYRLHGFPVAVISDRDPVFTSQFWQHFFKLAGAELRMSSSYHPQSDGQTERVNQCLETFLRCFVNACPKKWSFWLPTA